MHTRGDHSAESARRQACAEAEPWPTPRPLASTLAEVCPFDPDLLPETLRPWVLDLAERLQVPPDYPAAALTVMLAGAIGRRALIRPQRHDHWVVKANLWGTIVGRYGVMQSPVLRAALGPLQRRQALAMTVYESETDLYRRQLENNPVLNRMRRTVTTAVRDHDDGGAWDVEPPPPPVCTRYLVNEATVEKLHVILKENPHGVLYLRDELSGWMSQLDRRGRERERAFFLETWEGD